MHNRKGAGQMKAQWLTRLRAQPGFKAAAVAFCLTLVLGLGGGAAYAYWQASARADITASTQPVLVPVQQPLQCSSPWHKRTELSWPAAAGNPQGTNYLLTFSAGNRSVSYILPQETLRIELSDYRHGLRDVFGEGWWRQLNVTVSTAVFPTYVAAPERAGRQTALLTSQTNASRTFWYMQGTALADFSCDKPWNA